MTDAKKPTITMPDLKRDREDESNALYVMRLVQQPVLPQDAYSPNEVARLLEHQQETRVRLRKLAETPAPAAQMAERRTRLVRPARRAHRMAEGLHRSP